MNALRFTLAAAVLSAALAACSGGSPTAPARDPARREADAAPNDSSHASQPNTVPTQPILPTDPPPPGDGKQIYGSGS